MTVNIIQFPSGRWGYVGKVPDELYYEDGATPEQIQQGKEFGERFGPKRRSFETAEDAEAFAESRGYSVIIN